MSGSRCWVEKEGPGGAEDPGHWALTLPFGLSVAVNRLPDFLAAPNTPRGQPLPHHQCSIHLNCEDTLLVHRAFEDALDGLPSKRWGTWRRSSPWLEHRVCVGVGAGPTARSPPWAGLDPRVWSLEVWLSQGPGDERAPRGWSGLSCWSPSPCRQTPP